MLAATRGLPLWLRLAGALALPLAVFAIRDGLGGAQVSWRFPFVPVVVVCALSFGRGGGVAAVLASTLMGRLTFAPYGSLSVGALEDELELIVIFATMAVVAIVIDALFAAMERRDAIALALQRQGRLLDQSYDAIVARDEDGRIVYWSRGAEALYGHTAEEAVGTIIHDLLATKAPEGLAAIAASLEQTGSWMGELVHRTRAGQRISVESRHTVVLDVDRKVVLETNRDITGERAAQQTVRESEIRLAAILDAMPIGVIVADAQTGAIRMGNRAVEAVTRHPLIFSPDIAAYQEWEAYDADGQRVAGTDYPLAKVLATGAPAQGTFHYRRGDASMAWVEVHGAPIFDSYGTLKGGVAAIVDVDKARQMADHQQLLLAELSHRVKNVLTIVQAIASSTLARARSMPDFAEAFEGRLEALATAHSLLLRTEWRGLGLRTLVSNIFAPFGEQGALVTLIGDDVRINAKEGVAMALVLHELVTNAAKYGALSVPTGLMRVEWRVAHDNGSLVLEWMEEGLPNQPKLDSVGLGMKLIARSVGGDLGGHAEPHPRPNGLVWKIEFPLASCPSTQLEPVRS